MEAVNRVTFGAQVVEASHARPVLVDVWGPRCAPCLAMMPWVDRLAASQADALQIVKLNSADDRQLCFELRIMGLPTFMLYRNGEEVWRLSGASCTPAGIREKLGLDE